MSNFEFGDEIQGMVEDVGREFQRAMDDVARSHSGQPVEQVKPAVRAALRRIDVEASEAEIADYATAISNGDRIEVEFG